MSLHEFKTLLDNPNNNILVDIHSCPIERSSIEKDDPNYEDYFTEVPRGIYVVLISDFGQNKVGEDNVQHQDRRMYGNPSWPWTADPDIIRTAQIYFPRDEIFNPLMMFGQPGEYDENYDIFNVVTGQPASFNKSDKRLQGKEGHMTYSRKTILAKLRGRQPKIVYIATCDPMGNRPSTWRASHWNTLIDRRLDLQDYHRGVFDEFVKTYGNVRRSARQQGYDASGRSAMGLSRNVDQDHFEIDSDSKTPLRITAVSIDDDTKACVTPCDYKKTCANSIPGIGHMIKRCQNKYCTFESGEKGICREYSDVEMGRRKRSRKRQSKKRRGGKRRISKKKMRKRRHRSRKKRRKRLTKKRRRKH